MVIQTRLSRQIRSVAPIVVGWVVLLGLTLAGWFFNETTIGKLLAAVAALWWACGATVLVAWLLGRLK